jgi:hypothetical protein
VPDNNPNSIFSPDNLQRELDNLPKEEANIGITADKTDIGLSGTVSKSLGKGAYIEGEGSWMKQAGWKVAAWFGWKGK